MPQQLSQFQHVFTQAQPDALHPVYASVRDLERCAEAPRGQGAQWRVRGEDGEFLYEEAARDATDHHREIGDGAKVYARPVKGSDLMPVQFGARRNGFDDDGAALEACVTYAQRNGYAVDLGVGEYRIAARSTPLLSYNRRLDDASANRFALFGRGPSMTRLCLVGDCTDFLFKVEGNTDGYSATHPRASWFDFCDFSINGNGHNADLFSFVCADRCNIDNVTSFNTHGYGLFARQLWDSLCNVRFVHCGDNLRLPIFARSEAFTVGQTITGTTSGATAWLMDVDGGTAGTLHVTQVEGAFVDGEAIIGATDGKATASIPDGIEGAEKAVVDFDYQFEDRLTDSACNQVKFPETVQIEGYRWRAMHWGKATRQNYFGGKIHWIIDRHYGGPAVYLDGPTSNHFVPGMMMAHTPSEPAIVMDGSKYNATGNRLIGISGGKGLRMTGDCRSNVVSLCAFDNGDDACVVIEGGRDNMIRDNMPRGSGPEIENRAKSPDFALLDRRIPERVHIGETEPPGGWGPARLNVHTKQNLVAALESARASGAVTIEGGGVSVPE